MVGKKIKDFLPWYKMEESPLREFSSVTDPYSKRSKELKNKATCRLHRKYNKNDSWSPSGGRSFW